MEKKRIGVKDLVNIGIFAVLYFIAFFIAGITGFIPVMPVLYSWYLPPRRNPLHPVFY